MSAENTGATSSSSFTKAFLLGLIVGIVVGGFAGAFLPPLLEGYTLPTPTSSRGTVPKGSTRQENREAPPTDPKPEEPTNPAGDQPKPEEPAPENKPNA